MEQQANPNWVPQEDGTFLPSQELLEKVRANPQDYPDAVKDFSVISGKSEDEVQRILDNPLRAGGWADYLVPDYGMVQGMSHVTEGLGEAAGWAVENAGDLLGIEGSKKAADFIRTVTDANPAFATEEGAGEVVTEVLGQAAPAVAAGLATGGAGLVGWLTGAAVGGTVATASFNPDDATVVEQLGEYVPLGPVKDALTINEDDGTGEKLLKHFIAGALIEGVAQGAFTAIGKVGKLISKGDLQGAKEVLEEAELGADIAAPKVVPETVELVEEKLAARVAPAEAEAEKLSTEMAAKVLREDAARIVQGSARAKEIGEEFIPPVSGDVLEAFEANVFRPLKRFDERTGETTVLSKLGPDLVQPMRAHAAEVFGAIQRGDADMVVKLLKRGAQFANQLDVQQQSASAVFNASLIMRSLDRMSDYMEEVVTAIRKDPSLKTRPVWRKLAADYLKQTGDVGELWRNIGSSASYQLLLRKGGTFLEGDVEEFLHAAAAIDKEVDNMFIHLRDKRGEFVAKKIIALDDVGINPADLLDDLFRQFDNFDAEAEGIRKNMRQAKKLTPYEKMGMVAQFMQRLKDVQAVMLLGQFMTSMTEIVSTGTNAWLMPILRRAGGEKGRWAKEYAGQMYAAKFAYNIGKKAFIKGKGVLDDWDIKEGTYSRPLDYEHMNSLFAFGWRFFKMAVDLSVGSSEFFKATRAYGIAYADAMEAGLKAGLTPAKARDTAIEYAKKRFNADGALMDADLRIRAAETAFQNHFDGSTMTGQLGQWVENIRNSEAAGGTLSVLARGAMPFFRTLANIGGSSAQFVMPPGVPTLLKKFAPNGTHVAKFLDDFTGKNGEIAKAVAIGRQRIGLGLVASGFAITQMDGVEITGPSRGQRWDAKKRAFEEYPASSLIIGNTAIDLTRLLPFSAPLLLVGTLRDLQLEDSLRMEGGEYDPANSTLDYFARYGQGLGLTTALIMQDAGAARGVFQLFDAVYAALSEGDAGQIGKYFQAWTTQFTPGPLRMGLRSGGDVQHEGYEWLEKWWASAGGDTEWERLDFFGNPIRYPVGKGVDPTNRRVLRLDDQAYREFATLNKVEGLALSLPRPDALFDKAYWKALGLDPDSPIGSEPPSAVDLKTKDGQNAWKAFRSLVYKGRAAEDDTVSTSQYGDKVSVGKVLIKKGENFEQAMRRIIDTQAYKNLTPDARKKVWDATFGYFRTNARKQLEKSIVVDPSHFQKSRYGSPIAAPATLEDTKEAGKKLAGQVQSTRGAPRDLDALFAP